MRSTFRGFATVLAAGAVLAALLIPVTASAAAESACAGTAATPTCTFRYQGNLWTRGVGVDGVDVRIKDADGNVLLSCGLIFDGDIAACRSQGDAPAGLEQGATLTCEAAAGTVLVAYSCASGLTG